MSEYFSFTDADSAGSLTGSWLSLLGEGMMRDKQPTRLWGCQPFSLVLSAVRSLPSRSRAQQGSEATMETPLWDLVNLPSNLFTYSHLTLGLLKLERSQII